jgi:hypothetical protein
VSYLKAAQYRDTQIAQLILEYVEEGPSPVFVPLEPWATP